MIRKYSARAAVLAMFRTASTTASAHLLIVVFDQMANPTDRCFLILFEKA